MEPTDERLLERIDGYIENLFILPGNLSGALAQCLVDRGSIFLGKRRLFSLLEILNLNLLSALPRSIPANSIHRYAMRDGVEP